MATKKKTTRGKPKGIFAKMPVNNQAPAPFRLDPTPAPPATKPVSLSNGWHEQTGHDSSATEFNPATGWQKPVGAGVADQTLDQYLASVGIHAPASTPLNDIPSGLAIYKQTREALNKNAGIAQTQIGQSGAAAESAIRSAAQPVSAAALTNIAQTRAANQELTSSTDRSALEAAGVLQGNGVAPSPELLAEAARQKGLNKTLTTMTDEAATQSAAQIPGQVASSLEGAAAATQGARTTTQRNLDAMLAEIGMKEADASSKMTSENAAINAQNVNAQNDYAILRLKMDQERNAGGGTAAKPTQTGTTNISGRERASKDIGDYQRQYAEAGGKGEARAITAYNEWQKAIEDPKYKDYSVDQLLGLLREHAKSKNLDPEFLAHWGADSLNPGNVQTTKQFGQ